MTILGMAHTSIPSAKASCAGLRRVACAPVVVRRAQRSARLLSAQAAPSGRPSVTVPEVYTDSQDPEIVAYQAHQKSAAKPSAADESKTMMGLARFGVLSTVSVRDDTMGLPLGAVVEYAVDTLGRPIFAVSSLSPHCNDLKEDKRASLTVMAPGFKGLTDARFTLQGRVSRVPEEAKPPLREAFLKKYPDAFWVDFADFKWFIMDDITAGRFNGGFGAAKKLSAEEYLGAPTDPVAPFSKPVCSHMNGDHLDDMKAMIRHYVGMNVEGATMLDLDRLGMNFEVKHKGQAFKLRLPFPKPAEDRKGIKEAIVEMTQAAASSAPPKSV